MSRRKQKNFSCLSLSYDSATREFHVLKIQNKKKKEEKKEQQIVMRVIQPIKSNKKKKKREKKSNNFKTVASKFKYSLIVGQQTKPSRYKKKIYSRLNLFDVSIKENFSQEIRK